MRRRIILLLLTFIQILQLQPKWLTTKLFTLIILSLIRGLILKNECLYRKLEVIVKNESTIYYLI